MSDFFDNYGKSNQGQEKQDQKESSSDDFFTNYPTPQEQCVKTVEAQKEQQSFVESEITTKLRRII